MQRIVVSRDRIGRWEWTKVSIWIQSDYIYKVGIDLTLYRTIISDILLHRGATILTTKYHIAYFKATRRQRFDCLSANKCILEVTVKLIILIFLSLHNV